MTRRESIGAFVLLLVISTAAFPQTPASSFEQLMAEGALRPNQTVYVTDAWGQRLKGRLGEIRPGTLVLRQGSDEIRMTEANVDRIQRGDSLENGLWLGVGAGIVAAWIAPRVVCDLPDDECAGNVFAAIGLPSIAAGAVTGAIIDAALTKTVFSGTLGQARIHLSPVLGRQRAGALATIRF